MSDTESQFDLQHGNTDPANPDSRPEMDYREEPRIQERGPEPTPQDTPLPLPTIPPGDLEKILDILTGKRPTRNPVDPIQPPGKA